MSSSTAVTLFVSYAHEDEDLREELVKHLKLLQRQGVIEGWYDRLIQGGQEWDQEIQTRLLTSNIILLLVSADFLASDYCWDKEVQQAMERHTRGDAVVIPIILRACDWNSAPFGKIQALPRDARPVMSWSDRDEALLDIARGIRQVALRIQARLTQEQRKSEEIEKLRSRLPEWMDRDHLHQARDTLRELEKLGWKGADFEDWRERIDEAIRRGEKTADWLESAIRASEGEHYEEALKYLEKAASLSPDHSGIQKLRTAVESRQQKLTSRAVPLHSGDPSAPTNQEDRAREEEPREKTGPAFPSAEEERDGQTPNQVELKAPSLLSSTSEEDVARGAERDSELPALASRVLSLFRTRSRLQMTGGFLIVFVAVLLFYRMGPATGDQNGGDQVAPGLELSGSRAVLDTSSSDELDSAGDRLAGKDRSPAGKSNTGSPVPLTGTEVASRTDQQEASTETSGQLGESSTPPTDVAATAPSVPPPSTTTDQSSIRTPIRNADADSTNDVASGSRAQVASQPDPLAGNWLKVGFDGLQKDSR